MKGLGSLVNLTRNTWRSKKRKYHTPPKDEDDESFATPSGSTGSNKRKKSTPRSKAPDASSPYKTPTLFKYFHTISSTTLESKSHETSNDSTNTISPSSSQASSTISTERRTEVKTEDIILVIDGQQRAVVNILDEEDSITQSTTTVVSSTSLETAQTQVSTTISLSSPSSPLSGCTQSDYPTNTATTTTEHSTPLSCSIEPCSSQACSPSKIPNDNKTLPDELQRTPTQTISLTRSSSDIFERHTDNNSNTNGSSSPIMKSYYLRNFFMVLDTVMEKDAHLFTADEIELISTFRKASDQAQRLFVRLYYRKGPWFQLDKIQYEEISNPRDCARELLNLGLFEAPQSVADVIHLLSTQELRDLLRCSSSSPLQRDALLNQARVHLQRQRTLDGRSVMPKSLRECVRISETMMATMKRVHRLFFLNQSEDQTPILMVSLGKVQYPKYLLSRSSENYGEDKQTAEDDESSSDEGENDDIDQQASQQTSSQNQNQEIQPRPKRRWHWRRPNENMNTLKKVGLFSVFASRSEMDEYEETLEKARMLAMMLGEDLDADLASGTANGNSGESLASMHIRAAQAARTMNGGPISKMNEEQVNIALQLVNEAVEKFKEHQFARAVENAAKIEQPNASAEELQDKKTPKPAVPFLRRFTAAWLWSSMIWVGVSLLERLRKYEDAVNNLRLLLAETHVNTNKRGEWWIRLAFDLAHLKQTQEAVNAVREALRDPHVRPQHRIRLQHKLRVLLAQLHRQKVAEEEKQRSNGKNPKKRKRRESGEDGKELTAKQRKELQKQEKEATLESLIKDVLGDDVSWLQLRPPPKRVIQARPLPRSNNRGNTRSVFIGYDDQECSVEQLALQFYKLKMNFSDGLHCEGHIFHTMFGLAFWDIIFDASIPYVFQTPFQDAPLDFWTEEFYRARKSAIDERLEIIRNDNSAEVTVDIITASYKRWHGRVCRGVAWDKYSLKELCTVARCVGGSTLSAIFRRFAVDFRMTHSGMPDLIMWNPATLTAKFVEVKGPRDKLSDKQLVWIDVLLEAGADVEVLYIREELKENEVDDALDLCLNMDSNLIIDADLSQNPMDEDIDKILSAPIPSGETERKEDTSASTNEVNGADNANDSVKNDAELAPPQPKRQKR